MNRAGIRLQHHVDHRVPGQGVLEHHPRLAVVPVHQRVDQRERVAGAGVPAADQDRLARDGRRVSGRRSRSVSAEHPPGLAEEHPHHALHQVVVDALEVRRPDPPAEPGGQPEPEQHHQQQRLAGQVEHRRPTAAAAPASRPGSTGESAAATISHSGRVTQTRTVEQDDGRRDDQPPQQPRSSASSRSSRYVDAGVVRRVDPVLHPGEVAVGQERVVAARRAAGREHVRLDVARAARSSRGRTGAGGRSRTTPGPPPTAGAAA